MRPVVLEDPFVAIYGPVRAELNQVEACLDEVARVDTPWLAHLLQHVLKNSGKRIRPALTLLAGKLYSGPTGPLVSMAAAVELLHTATLMHDDTLDKATVRRGKPTVNALWNGDTAILAGDYLFARAAEMVSSLGDLRLTSLFARTLMVICQAELERSSSAFRCDQTRESYFQRIGSKTASLFAGSTESGALLSNASDAAVRALREYGHTLGMAFQIADDILDFLGDEGEMGKPTGSDLLEGTLTLPAILFLEKEPGDNIIRQAFEGGGGKRTLKRAIQDIRRSPYIDESYRIAKEFCTRASQSLGPLPDNPSHRSLVSLAEYVVSRRR